ncbi:MAG: aspartate aminotransferase family protein [Deltaproteobacteria bacterium]|nr:MAG: aspartate aminotransferase family protein [Deltaproteobacteria bacterium]
MSFPKSRLPREKVLETMREAACADADWRAGRTFSLVYFAGDEVLETVKEAYATFLSTNGLSPFAFPSLQRFESEVCQATAEMLNAPPEAVGTMTSGGTESILMAVKSARDKARAERGVTEPELLLPESAHPAFYKAAHYLGLTCVRIPLAEDFRADVEAAESLVSERTVLMVGSAPGYPHGVIDPIEALSEIARRHGIPFHVDACLGGFLLPWVERLGYEVPVFDFRAPGVTSMSADCHKYGYAARGASTITYRDASLRRYQYYAYTEWPGGLYGSPSMLGSRPGGAIAAAWAVMHLLGEEGYLALAKTTMETTRRLIDGIRATNGLTVLGDPEMSVFAFTTTDGANAFALGEALQQRGWGVDVQHLPPALHLMVTPAHAEVVEPFLADLQGALESVRRGEVSGDSGMAAMYGMAGAMPDRGPLGEMIVEMLGQLLPPRAA